MKQIMKMSDVTKLIKQLQEEVIFMKVDEIETEDYIIRRRNKGVDENGIIG